MPKTHYEVIGAAASATGPELRKAYLQRARKLHPDQYVDRPAADRAKAEKAMKELNVAWSVLSDVEARRKYDLELGRALSRGTGPISSGRATGWRPFDPDRPPVPTKKPGPQVADEREMEIRGAARLLRPGPLLGMIAVVVALIIGATLATGGGTGDADAPPARPVVEPTGQPIGCLDLAPVVERVRCGGHDAILWLTVNAADGCPDDLESVFRQGEGGLYCFTRVR